MNNACCNDLISDFCQPKYWIMTTNDWIGSLGVGLILIAYFCSTLNLISSHGRIFFLLNAVGGATASFASYLISYWPFVVLEGTWTVVSLIGLFKVKKGD